MNRAVHADALVQFYDGKRISLGGLRVLSEMPVALKHNNKHLELHADHGLLEALAGRVTRHSYRGREAIKPRTRRFRGALAFVA